MKSFYDYCENVKRKTDLTDWMLQIKSNPKDSLTYLVLADFLQEKNGENKEIYINVAHYLRIAVENNLLVQIKPKNKTENEEKSKKMQRLENIERKLRSEIVTEFTNMVNSPDQIYARLIPKQTQHQASIGTTRFNYEKNSMTIPQMRDRNKMFSPEDEFEYDDGNEVRLKPDQSGNVAIHDLSDEKLQLSFIFRLGIRIFNNIVDLDKKYNCTGESESIFPNGFFPNGAINLSKIIKKINVSYQCCDNYNSQSIQVDINEIQSAIDTIKGDLHEIESGSDFYTGWADKNQLNVQLTVLTKWVEALNVLIEKGCEAYRSLAAKIIKDFRTKKR